MKAKIIATALVIMAVAMYTTAVINFMAGNVLSGISDVLMACSDVVIAWVLLRLEFYEKALVVIGKDHFDLKEALHKGVPATLTVKDGKGTVTIGQDADADEENEEIPESELTDEEKRIKRMAEEYDQLAGRYERLTNFLASEKFKALPDNSRTLLERQHKAMGDYEAALKERIKIDCANTGLEVETKE